MLLNQDELHSRECVGELAIGLDLLCNRSAQGLLHRLYCL